MPLVRTANLKYCTSAQLTITPTQIGWFDLNANGAWDPEVATGGGQPMGFNKWAELFDQYIVTGSKCSVTFSYKHTSDDKVLPVVCGIYLADDATIPYTDWKGLVEARKGTHRTMVPQQAVPIRAFSKFSCRKFFNIKDPLDEIGRLGAQVNANPTETAVFIVWADKVFRTDTDSITIIAKITLDMHVVFTEPRDLARA